jgi:hypothetical protein
MKMEQTESSETSAYKIHTPGNYPSENIQHSEHGESLKSGILRNYEFLNTSILSRQTKKWTIVEERNTECTYNFLNIYTLSRKLDQVAPLLTGVWELPISYLKWDID